MVIFSILTKTAHTKHWRNWDNVVLFVPSKLIHLNPNFPDVWSTNLMLHNYSFSPLYKGCYETSLFTTFPFLQQSSIFLFAIFVQPRKYSRDQGFSCLCFGVSSSLSDTVGNLGYGSRKVGKKVQHWPHWNMYVRSFEEWWSSIWRRIGKLLRSYDHQGNLIRQFQISMNYGSSLFLCEYVQSIVPLS